MSPELGRFLAESRARVEALLEATLPPESEPPRALHEAMRYAVLGGGKRLRPALAYAAALACEGRPQRADPVAGAVELVHAYSLVHDDLPAMDDDQERRGRPTVHVRFGEAPAILAGDALLALAFEVLAQPGIPAEVVARLARAAGSRELVGGQADDLGFAPAAGDLASLTSIHARKTASLFGFAVWGGARTCGAGHSFLEPLERFGRSCGLAFQLVDDLLDAGEGACSALQVLPAEDLRERVHELVAEALDALKALGEEAWALRGLAEATARRLP